MSELTKEYLDKKLDKLVNKENLKESLDVLEVNLKSHIEQEIAELARMTNNGLEEIKRELNVKDRVDNLDRRMFRIEQALNIKN